MIEFVFHRTLSSFRRLIARLTTRTYSWGLLLMTLAGILACANVYAFYPGFLSNDSIDQLMQALGDKPLQNWHPPVMVILWKILLRMSGHAIGSLLVFQVFTLWTSLTVLAIYVYRQTLSRRLSLMPLALGATPFVVNISGVIWKDVEMAVSLMLAFVLLLASRSVGIRKQSIVVGLACIYIIYAANLRYNALFAIVPLLWLIYRLPGLGRTKYIFLTVVVAGIFVITPLIAAIRPVQETHPASSVMIDDVVNLYAGDRLRKASMSRPLKQTLADIENRCNLDQVKISIMIACATDHDRTVLKSDRYGELTKIWLMGMIHDPLRYIKYRTTVFVYGFIQPDNVSQAYLWQNGTEPTNPYGLTSTNNMATKMIRGYIGFTAFDFGFIYRPYIWLLLGTAMAWMTIRKSVTGTHSDFILSLVLSGVLYILGYLPFVIGYDFRYIYWAPMAISVACILAVIDYFGVTNRSVKY